MNDTVSSLKWLLKCMSSGRGRKSESSMEDILIQAINYIERLETLIAFIDKNTPRADQSCDDPGISVSVAAERELRDRNHPLFVEEKS